MKMHHETNSFRVWGEDEGEKVIIVARGMPEALDKAADLMGYADYTDMAQQCGWSEDEGLNIELVD